MISPKCLILTWEIICKSICLNIKNENSSSQGDHKYNQATNTRYPSRSLKQKIRRIITG